MTPIQETEIDMEKLEERTMPSLTWKINEEKAEVRGETDELDAMRQAVSKILQTERYRYAVYDWNYGVELEDLYGKNVSYVIPELKRRIEDALLADDRVTAVTDFSFREEKGSVTAILRRFGFVGGQNLCGYGCGRGFDQTGGREGNAAKGRGEGNLLRAFSGCGRSGISCGKRDKICTGGI